MASLEKSAKAFQALEKHMIGTKKQIQELADELGNLKKDFVSYGDSVDDVVQKVETPE